MSLSIVLPDAHCHINLTADPESVMQNFHPDLNRRYAIMSTSHLDTPLVMLLAKSHSPIVVPFFGIHPWYSHLYSTENVTKEAHYRLVLYPEPLESLLAALPVPIPIDTHVAAIEGMVQQIISDTGKNALVGIGEIGLDKPFRVPHSGYLGAPEIAETSGLKLSPCRVSMEHQERILRAMLAVAEKFDLPVLLHCVKSHGKLLETVRQFSLNRVVLHSFSGSPEVVGQWNRALGQQKVSLSFSYWINGAEEDKLRLLLLQLADTQVLTETDMSVDKMLCSDHGEHLEGIFGQLCVIRGWSREEGASILGKNWDRLVKEREVET